MRTLFNALTAVALLAASGTASAGLLTLTTSASGDAQYAWNTRYGPYGYVTGSTTIGCGLQFGAPYGNDWTIGVFEIPIAALTGHVLDAATLEVASTGFGTGYYYGSAGVGWQNANGATGDVVADGRGGMGIGEFVAYIWHSDWGHDASGVRSFNVLTQVNADLAAGRAYSTFTIYASRDTGGGIYTAEGGAAPRIVASSSTIVPEPSGLALLALALPLLRRR
jgi:hypothetical protein